MRVRILQESQIIIPAKMVFKNKLLICGPCAVESEHQLFETAKQIKELINPDFFRAGLWKPRTNPNDFEGLGKEGIDLLIKVSKIFNMPVISEVANARHLELIANAGLSAFWLGARTVSNPLFVNEIINACSNNTNFTEFIKNPIFPDLDLWKGNINRFYNAGFKNVYAVFRGFYPYERTKYRNLALWDKAIEIKREFPNIKIICDPSHIAGNKNHIFEISQEAMNLNFDGLMIETHFDPQNALSDAKQQITPIELLDIITNLKEKSTSSDNDDFNSKINDYRNIIDKIDSEILDKLSERFIISEKIGKLKKENNVAPLQIERWKEVISTRENYAEKKNISKTFLLKLLTLIHDESIKRQNFLNE